MVCVLNLCANLFKVRIPVFTIVCSSQRWSFHRLYFSLYILKLAKQMLNFDLFNPSIVASKSLSPPAVYHLYSYKLISVDGPSEEESVKGECAMYYAPLTSNKFDLGL